MTRENIPGTVGYHGRHLAHPQQRPGFDQAPQLGAGYEGARRAITLCWLDEPIEAIVASAADLDCVRCRAIVDAVRAADGAR